MLMAELFCILQTKSNQDKNERDRKEKREREQGRERERGKEEEKMSLTVIAVCWFFIYFMHATLLLVMRGPMDVFNTSSG